MKHVGLDHYGDDVVRMAFKQVDKNSNGVLEWNEAIEVFKLLITKKMGTGDSSGGSSGTPHGHIDVDFNF